MPSLFSEFRIDFHTAGAQLQWRFDEMLSAAFSILDTKKQGFIDGVQLYAIFEKLGDRLQDIDELADIIGHTFNEYKKPELGIDVIERDGHVNLDGFREAIRTLTNLSSLESRKMNGHNGRRYKVHPYNLQRGKSIEDILGVQSQILLPDVSDPLLGGHHQNYEPLKEQLRNGPRFWKLLIRRLEVLLLIRQWSDAAGVQYTSPQANGDAERQTLSQSCTRDPEGVASTIWNLIQVIFIAYVTVSVPISFAFEARSECGAWGVIEAIVDIYFILDICLNFMTRYTDENGVIVTSPRSIACNYLRGWLIIDVLSCISIVGYVLPTESCEVVPTDSMDSAERTTGSAKLAKALRIAKVSRALRIARMQRALTKLNLNFDPGPALRILVLGGAALLTFHWLACIFYFIGSVKEDGWANGIEIDNGLHGTWDLYSISMFNSVYGSVDGATAFEMMLLVANHFVLNGIVYGMITASLATILVSYTASRQRCAPTTNTPFILLLQFPWHVFTLCELRF
eukprot:SAG31_NODE_1918_length_6921_cov_2.015245_4_plen_512_part_00